MQNGKGTLYLIPTLLSPDTTNVLPLYLREIVDSIHHFFVENERSARRFLKTLDKSITIDDRQFSLINTHSPADINQLWLWLNNKINVGVISEAGYPCIADPGNILAKEAHHLGARVVPLVGPNAMLMALAASGFSGQHFCFSGYIPVKHPERANALRNLENKAVQMGETQIFMETPYRNNTLFNDILKYCHAQTMLCIAADITAPTEFIQTHCIKDWKEHVPELHKRPAVFLLGR